MMDRTDLANLWLGVAVVLASTGHPTGAIVAFTIMVCHLYQENIAGWLDRLSMYLTRRAWERRNKGSQR